jgi:hypothetical protein
MSAKKPNPFSSRSYGTGQRPEPDEPFYEDDLDDEMVDVDDSHRVFGLGIPQADDRQPAYGQGVVISLLSAAALLLLAIIAIGDGDGTNPPVLQRADTLYWIISGGVLALTAGGAQYAERVAAQAAEEAGSGRPSQGLSTAWAVPLVSVFAAIMLTATFHNRWMLLFGPLIAFLGTAGALLSRDLLDEADEDSSRVASTIHTVVVHSVAFLAFSAIYLNKFESWLAVPLVTVVSFILFLETLERAGIALPPRVFYSILGAWVMGTSMLALNWWPTWGWTGGAVLLAVFYAVAGILLVWCDRQRVRRRDMIEFVGVGSLAVFILALRDAFL